MERKSTGAILSIELLLLKIHLRDGC